jgi:hypothetical protein
MIMTKGCTEKLLFGHQGKKRQGDVTARAAGFQGFVGERLRKTIDRRRRGAYIV